MPTNLRKLSRWLRRHYPLRRRVTVRIREARLMQGHHGYAIIHDDHATIRIASGPQGKHALAV